MAEFVKVGRLNDFPAGVIKACRVGNKSIAVVQVAGRVHAYANSCPHAGYTLSGGIATESRIICDVHGAHFDIDTGEALIGPASDPLEMYEVRVIGDDILVAKGEPD